MFRLSFEIQGINAAFSGLNNANGCKIPKTFWLNPLDRLTRIMEDRASHIVRFGVSKATRKWRRWAYFKDYMVEAHRGEGAHVLNSPKVGRRTGTFIKDLRKSQEPGVHTSILGEVLEYSIVPEAFAKVGGGTFKGKGYPTIFNQYLINRGIVPEEGIVSVDSGEEKYLFKAIENQAIILFSRQFQQTR